MNDWLPHDNPESNDEPAVNLESAPNAPQVRKSGIKVLVISLARRGGMLHFHDCLIEGLAPLCTVASLTAATADHADRLATQSDIRHFFVDTGQGIAGTVGRLIAPSTWRSIQTTINTFNPDIVHISGAQEWNPAIGRYLKQRRIPFVYTVHDVIHHEGVPLYFRITESIFRKLPTGFVVLTEAAKQQLVDQGRPLDKIRVIPHGTYAFFEELSGDATAEKNGAGNGADEASTAPKEILFFGRIEPYKGLPVLVDAVLPLLEANSDWKLVIAGSGDLGELAPALDHPQIEVINRFVSDAEVASLMRRAAIIALPYLSATQSGVIPTAFPFEKPIVATAVGGIPDMIRDDVTGLLVPPNNVGALREALSRLMADEALRERLGKAGAEFARSALDWHAIAVAHVNFYRDLLLETYGGFASA